MTTGYPVDRLSPARHVATELDKAAPAALSSLQLAANYMHPNTGDLARVKEQERADDPAEWLINDALDRLRYSTGEYGKGKLQIVAEGDQYRLAEGVTFTDLRFNGR